MGSDAPVAWAISFQPQGGIWHSGRRMSGSAPTPPPFRPPWERFVLWRRVHRWGVRNQKLYYVTPPSVWAVMIYLLSMARIDTPEVREIVQAPGVDKLLHAVFYAVLALLVLRGWQRDKMPPLGLHGFVLLLCMTFGAMIEVIQGVIPYRQFDPADIFANGVGALCGQVVWHLMMMAWGRRTRLYPGLLRPDFKNSPANPANLARRMKKLRREGPQAVSTAPAESRKS